VYNGKSKIIAVWLALFCLFVCDITKLALAAAATTTESLQEINNFLNQKKYLDAYQLAQNLSAQKMGEPSFDLLFARAALAAQKPDVASLAFERVLMSEPNNVDAKFGLAEAYYNLKMYNDAEIEAQSLLLKPNSYGAPFNSEVQLLLSKIKKGESSMAEKPYNIYGRMIFGYDNNVAASTDEDYGRYLSFTAIPYSYDKSNADQVAAYNALYYSLAQSNNVYKSVYIYPQIGIGGKYIPKPQYNLFWDFNVSHKDYLDLPSSAPNYNIDQVNLSFGINCNPSPLYLLNGSFYYQEYIWLNKRYRESPIGSISLSRALNANNTLKLYTNNGVLSYPNYSQFSVNMYSGGLEWSCSSSHNLLVAQVFGGENRPRGGAPSYNGNNFYGFDISAKHQFTPKLSLTADAIYQRSIYAGIDATAPFAPVRRDTFRQFTAGLYYKIQKHYTWYAVSSYTNTSSNVFIYKYDRLESLTGISFDF